MLVRYTDKFLGYGVHVQLADSVLVAVQYEQTVQSRLAHRRSQVCFRRRKAEKLRSAVAAVGLERTISSNLVEHQS